MLIKEDEIDGKNVITTGLIFILSVFFMMDFEKPSFADDNSSTMDKFFKTEFVYEARVTIDRERRNIGDSKYGWRGIVWITGDTFKGPKRIW